MEKLVTILIPLMLCILLFRLFLYPMKLVFKLAIHVLGGLLCLWLLNSISVYTGILFPINTFTVLLAGFLGVPGIVLMALLEIFRV